jgi:hypothetical protein
MLNNLYNTSAKLWIAVEDLKSNVKKLERGDADSSGSTMRTAGVVALILIIFTVIAAAVIAAANGAAAGIANPLSK